MPLADMKAGNSSSRSPLSCVLVVVASVISAGADGRRAHPFASAVAIARRATSAASRSVDHAALDKLLRAVVDGILEELVGMSNFNDGTIEQ